MRPKHRAELNALMALATPPAVSTGGDRSSIGGDNFYLPLMSLSSSRPEWPQNGVDYDSDDGDTRPRALSLAGVPEIIQRRICFFLNVPSARNLAITCSGLRDCAEERIWETVDIHRLMNKTAIWSTRQCYDLTRLLILAHPIRAKFIRHIKIKWQARCGLNKRDSLIFSHPSQVPMGLDSSHVCNDLERPLKDLDGPGAKWRVKLNSFPTLPACRDISVDVWEEIGLDFIIRRLFDIAPNARRLCLDEGEADELGLPSRRLLRGRKTCHLPNSLESFELYSPLPGSRDILSGLLKGSAHLTCLTITGLSRGWVGYEKGISEAIIQDGDGIETLVADNTIIACMKSWPRDLQHLTGIYEEDLRAPYSLAELAARIPATPARKLTLISTEGFGPDEFDVWEHLPHLPEQLAQPHATKTSFPSTMDHIASSCHVVDDLVLHAADRNPALIHLNLLTDLTGQRAIYQIYTYKRLNGDTCTRLLGQHREPSPALATWAGSVHDAIPINYSYDTAYVDRASFNGRFVLETELEQVWTLAGQRAQELWLTEPCREFYLPEETWEALERACPA